MKISTLVALFGFSLLIAASVDVGQLQCSENDCYHAVWGDESLLRIIEAVTDCQAYLTTTVVVYPITTITVVSETTSTTTTSCSTTSTIAIVSLPPGPTLSAQVMEDVEARQESSTDWFTTTTYGSFPSYATPACATASYASACSCGGVTQFDVTYLGTTQTATATTTLTDVFTTGPLCPIVTISLMTDAPISSSTLLTTSQTSNPFSSTASSLSLSGSTNASSSITDTSTSSSSASSSSSPASSSFSNSSDPSSTSSQLTASSSGSLTTSSLASTTPSGSSTTSDSLFTSSTGSSSNSSSSSIDPTLTAAPIPTYPYPVCGGPGVELCDGSCHDTKKDSFNCGRCGNRCATGKDCVNGVCASPPCDSRCGWDRMCGARNSTCTCAAAVEGNGICFDKNKYKCDDPNAIKCQVSAFGQGGCPIGSACVREYCNCGSVPFSGICVKTEGCGDGGAQVLGPLIRLGEMERRRRVLRGLAK